mmetsp:Transcript_16207/g.36308  ORF Transcript_16207/g.36308 Transcript_16207/m.36308 type:complete len:206 (+) Transcript_16207:48-665(+)
MCRLCCRAHTVIRTRIGVLYVLCRRVHTVGVKYVMVSMHNRDVLCRVCVVSTAHRLHTPTLRRRPHACMQARVQQACTCLYLSNEETSRRAAAASDLASPLDALRRWRPRGGSPVTSFGTGRVFPSRITLEDAARVIPASILSVRASNLASISACFSKRRRLRETLTTSAFDGFTGEVSPDRFCSSRSSWIAATHEGTRCIEPSS